VAEGGNDVSIEKYYRAYSLVCDYCGKRLPIERPAEAHKSRREAGWGIRLSKGDLLDICDDCIFEEKGYEDNEQMRA